MQTRRVHIANQTIPAAKKSRPAASRVAAPFLKKSPGLVGKSFPIVGLGASAGGLEALEQFLSHVPVACCLAFVIVQHLDPTRKGIMDNLIDGVVITFISITIAKKLEAELRACGAQAKETTA